MRLAQTDKDVHAIQRLRARVFCDLWGATHLTMTPDGREYDRFDPHCHHLVVVDTTENDRVVGGYRLLMRAPAQTLGGFLSETEFDVSRLLQRTQAIAEVSRACVDPTYRSRGVMALLWRGMYHCIQVFSIEMLFGLVSFQGQDPSCYARQLSYLHHFYLAPEPYRPHALPTHRVRLPLVSAQDLTASDFAALPPLAKGYARLGGHFGQDAFIDYAFPSVDMCMVLDTRHLSDRYARHYESRDSA